MLAAFCSRQRCGGGGGGGGNEGIDAAGWEGQKMASAAAVLLEKRNKWRDRKTKEGRKKSGRTTERREEGERRSKATSAAGWKKERSEWINSVCTVGCSQYVRIPWWSPIQAVTTPGVGKHFGLRAHFYVYIVRGWCKWTRRWSTNAPPMRKSPRERQVELAFSGAKSSGKKLTPYNQCVHL